MSWSARTWQPTIRRDGPLVVVSSFFLLPSLFFFATWYADYLVRMSRGPVLTGGAALAALAPSLVCFQMAGRAGRRRLLWAVLILAGSLLAMWLPAQYLIPHGPLPAGVYAAVPTTFRQTLAVTLVSLIPLLMGSIPAMVYALAVGLERPLPGVAPRGAVLLAAGGGVIVWYAALFISLLTPWPPPFMPLEPQITINAQLEPPPALPGDVVPLTWQTLLWRLRDGSPPGATEVEAAGDRLRLNVSREGWQRGLLATLMGRGAVEFVDVGDSPPAAGTFVSTTLWPAPGAELAFDTVASSDDLVADTHWSGAARGRVTLEPDSNAPILILDIEGAAMDRLSELATDRRGVFLSLVLDNVVVLSFPLQGAIEGQSLVIRRVPPEIAIPLAAILRYGPLPLVPELAASE